MFIVRLETSVLNCIFQFKKQSIGEGRMNVRSGEDSQGSETTLNDTAEGIMIPSVLSL